MIRNVILSWESLATSYRQGQETPIVHVWWRGLDPARERFDRSVRAGHHPVNHLGFIKAFRLQVVHQIIGEIRYRMAGPTLSFAEKDLLSMEFSSGSFLGIKPAIDIQFGRGRKI